jgi:hypothetical protein
VVAAAAVVAEFAAPNRTGSEVEKIKRVRHGACGNANEDTACPAHVPLHGLCCGRLVRGRRSVMSTMLTARFLDRAPYV